jgi:hypothetical protein
MNSLRRVCECEVRSESGGRQSRNFPYLNGATAATRVPLSVQPQPGVCEQLMNSSCDLHALSFQIVKSSNGHVPFAVGEVEVSRCCHGWMRTTMARSSCRISGNVRRAIRQRGEERWVEQREKPRRCETNSTANEVSHRGSTSKSVDEMHQAAPNVFQSARWFLNDESA